MFARRNKRTQSTLDLREVAKKQAKNRQRRPFPRWLQIAAAALFCVAVAGGAYYLISTKLVHPRSQKDAMLQAVSRVGEHIILPTDETPTYGTVADASKLKDQTFFKQAANNDELLIYQKAKLTILYRPSIDKIVNIGPLIIGSSGSAYITSRFAIKNGSGKPESSDMLASRLRQLYPNATISSIQAASRSYPGTIAIDLTKKNQPLDEQVADSLGIKAGQPPLGEALPAGDILIIIGTDFK